MKKRQRFLQFSLRTMLLAMFVGIVAGQTYRTVIHEREMRLLREQFETEIDKVLSRNHDRPPRCAIIMLSQLSHKLADSPDYRRMRAHDRSRLGSRIEAERFRHFSRGDQLAAMRPKPTQFTKTDDMLARP